jgi:protein TonB
VTRKVDCRSPFGALLGELRDEQVRTRGGLSAASAAAERNLDLHVETGVVCEPVAVSDVARRARWIASLALHSLAVVAVLGLPLLRSDDLPAPTATVRAFFVQPAVAPPAPPPPPPAAPAAVAVRQKKQAAAVSPAQPFIAPAHIPDTVKAEDVVEAPSGVGEAGGVEGGVPGGVVGGVIGRLPEKPPPPPLARVRAGVEVKEPTKVKNVDPVYPDVAIRANIQGVVILELTIMPAGRVAEVKVLRSVPLLDEAAVAAARQWVYTPTLLDGVPVSVVMTVTVRFNLKDVGRG